jgi:hypothetical protein
LLGDARLERGLVRGWERVRGRVRVRVRAEP